MENLNKEIGAITEDTTDNVIEEVISETEEEVFDESIFDMDEEFMKEHNIDPNMIIPNDDYIEVSNFEDTVLKNAKENDLSDEDASMLLDLITRYNKDKTIKVYNSLPQKMKKVVAEIHSGMSNIPIESIAKDILQAFIQEANFEKELDDFNASLSKATDTPAIADMYSEHVKEMMEVKLIDLAEKMKENGEHERSQMFFRISSMFTSSYTFDYLREFMKTNKSARNHITKDLDKFSKFCRDVNLRNESRNGKTEHHFIYNDMNDTLVVLKDILTHRSEDDIKKFLIVLSKSFIDTPITDLAMSSYVYYSIKNIIVLAYVEENKTEFCKEYIKNIDEMITHILTVEEEHNLLVSSKTKKGK